MSNFEVLAPELELVEVSEPESDHSKLMKAFKKIQDKLDVAIEKKREKKRKSA